MIAELAKRRQRFKSSGPCFLGAAFARVQIVKELEIACFDAKQIAQSLTVACRLRPTLIGFFGLFAETESHAATFGNAFFNAHTVDATQNIFDKGDELFIRALARLQCDGSVTCTNRITSRFDDFLWSQGIALCKAVSLADSTVTAVVDTVVADFNEASKPQCVAVNTGRAVVGFAPQTRTTLSIG